MKWVRKHWGWKTESHNCDNSVLFFFFWDKDDVNQPETH